MRLADLMDLAEPSAVGSSDEACPVSYSDTLAPGNSGERMGMHMNIQGNIEALNSTTHNGRVRGHTLGDLMLIQVLRTKIFVVKI